jgi:hypothetical protein
VYLTATQEDDLPTHSSHEANCPPVEDHQTKSGADGSQWSEEVKQRQEEEDQVEVKQRQEEAEEVEVNLFPSLIRGFKSNRY